MSALPPKQPGPGQDHGKPIPGFMVGTLAEARELMALARAGKIKPTPMKEEPIADVQKWIDELRAGKVVGRIVLKN